MHIEDIRAFCKKLPLVTEDIKWGNDLCFCIGGKMFCVAPLHGELTLSFKVRDEEFDELSVQNGFVPAPYVARYKWVLLKDIGVLKRSELEAYIKQSYELVKAKLPKKALK